MDRRTFLKKTGQAAAASSLIAATSTLKGSAVAGQIRNVVVVMMENRSFDHLWGGCPIPPVNRADLAIQITTEFLTAHIRWPPDWTTGCGGPDPDHSYDGGRLEIDNGAMDGFLKPASNDIYSIGYYREQDFQFLPQFARSFTVCDQYFPSILAPTFPNRIFQLCGQTDRLSDSISLCSLPTEFSTTSRRLTSGAKYYFGNIPFLALFGEKWRN